MYGAITNHIGKHEKNKRPSILRVILRIFAAFLVVRMYKSPGLWMVTYASILVLFFLPVLADCFWPFRIGSDEEKEANQNEKTID